MTALLCTPVLVAVPTPGPNESHSPSEAGPLSVFQPLMFQNPLGRPIKLCLQYTAQSSKSFHTTPTPPPKKAVPKACKAHGQPTPALITYLTSMTEYPAIRKLKEEGLIFGPQFKSITPTGLSGADHMMSAVWTQRDKASGWPTFSSSFQGTRLLNGVTHP